MTKEKVSIEKVNIKIGKEEIPLTPKQAKELRDLLNDLFGETRKEYVPYPYPYPVYPYYRRWDYWTVTCGDDTTGGTSTWDGTITYCLTD